MQLYNTAALTRPLAWAVAILSAGSLMLAAPQAAHANAVISSASGAFLVGIGPDGELWDSNTGIGFQRTADGYDPLAPGTPRDSWGVSANGVGAFADYADFGTVGIDSSSSSFGPHGGTVTSSVLGGTLSVTQNYSFGAGSRDNVLAIATTVTNTSGSSQAVLFQRDVDWDVAPTEFFENSFGFPINNAKVTDSSFYGFENPDPTAPYFASCAAGCNDTSDLGGGIKLDLGTLAPRASDTFTYYYAINHIGTDASELLGELPYGPYYPIYTQSSENGPFPAFGVNGAVIAVATPEPASLAVLLGSLVGFGLLRRRQKTQA